MKSRIKKVLALTMAGCMSMALMAGCSDSGTSGSSSPAESKADSELASVTGLSQLAGKNVKVTTQLGTGWVDLLDRIPDVVKGANYDEVLSELLISCCT